MTALAAVCLVFTPGVTGAGVEPPDPWKGFTAEDFEKALPGGFRPAGQLLADVPESEAANDTCPGQGLTCGDQVVQARIDEPGDQDLYALSLAEGMCLSVGTTMDSTEVTDTFLQILSGDCAATLAEDDDNGPGPFSQVDDFRIPASGTYVIRVRHFLSGGTGRYRLFVKCVEAGLPNARCESADLLACTCQNEDSLGCEVDREGTTLCTGNDYNPLANGRSCTRFSANGQDVAYRVPAVAGTRLTLNYRSTADGSVYILTDCGSPADSCVAGMDAGIGGQTETLTYTFPQSRDYYVILDSHGTNTSGTWTLKATFECTVTPVQPVTWSGIKARHRRP